MVWSSMASKWPIPNLLCGMDHQKSKFLLIYGTFSVRGCWGQPMLLFWKLVDETQISKPQEYTDTFRQILTSIFLSVRAILKETVQYETPCIFASTNPQIWRQIVHWITSSNLGRTCCVQKLFLTFRTIFVHYMFSPCSAKRRASDKDLPVTTYFT